jgi:glycosyltransferase involved in cell wall biosynthesis
VIKVNIQEKNQHILIFSTTYLPVTGGLQYLLYWLAEEFDLLLDQDKYSMTTVSFMVPSIQHDVVQFDNIKFYEYGCKSSGIFNKLKIIFKLFQIIKKNQVNLLSCWDLISDGPIASIASKISGIPFVVSCHGQDIAVNKEYNYGALLDLKNRVLAKYTIKTGSGFSTISSDMIECAVNANISRNKIKLIPNGIQVNTVECHKRDVNRLKKLHSINEKHNIILTFSGHRPIKGHLELLRAFSDFVKIYPDNCLVIGAKSSYTNFLIKTSIELHINDRVKFIGFVDGGDKDCWYRISDIYVNTAHFEPFGLTYLEAIKYQSAVLASNNGGGKDIFTHQVNGYLVDPNQHSQIVEGLCWLYNEKNREGVIKEGLKTMDLYSIERTAKSYLDWYGGFKIIKE